MTKTKVIPVEPRFMKDLHKVREQMTKEWKDKTAHEIVLSIRKQAAKSKYCKISSGKSVK